MSSDVLERVPDKNIRGDVSPLEEMCSVVCSSAGSSVMVEVGVFRGQSTRIWAKHFDKVVAVDPFAPYENDACGEKDVIEDAKERFLQLMEDERNIDLLMMPSGYAATYCSQLKEFQELPFVTEGGISNNTELGYKGKRGLPFVYIDGRHEYKHVIQNLREWSALNPKYIGGHDYNDHHVDVIKAVDEFREDERKSIDSFKCYESGDYLIKFAS